MYTFSSFVRLPEFNLDQIEEIQKSRPWLNLTREKVGTNLTDRCRITKTFTVINQFPWWTEWNGFYLEPLGVGKVQILEIGLKFSETFFIYPKTKTHLEGNITGLAVLDPVGPTHYWIRSGCFGVGKNEVGIYLTAGINSWEHISFESWKAFWHVANRYSKLFRVQRKLEQLRGTRKNSGAFERLSAEVQELLSESLMEV